MSVQSILSGQGAPLPAQPLNTETGKSTASQTNAAIEADQAKTQPGLQQQKPSAQQLKDAVKSMNDFVDGINSSLKFTVDDKSGQTVVKVVDNDTKEVIKQIPSEEMLAISQAVDKLKGLLVQQKA